jgi:CRISPR-associated protein Cas5h
MSNNEFTPNKTLIFDIRGPMAHFRKYYTNSSSLSYLFPPRTVVIGLIAGLLGILSEKHTKVREDIFYEKFDEKKCLVTISLRTKIKRIMQTINYLATDNFPKTPYKLLLKMIAGEIGHTQIPLEILLPENNNEIIYRIYFYHIDNKIYTELKRRLEEKRYVFPPYMGITEFLASINYIDEGKVLKNPNQEVKLDSVCKLKEVELDFNGKNFQYITEKMPTGFSNSRIPKETCDYICEINCRTINIKLKNNISCYSVTYSEGDRGLTDNILFI